MLIYSQMKRFRWHKNKVLFFNTIVTFQRRHEEGTKKAYRRDMLSNAYGVGKQVIVYNNAIMLISCGL